MRKPGNGNDKIVVVSNYTQTLDLIGKMCTENSWGFCRLDGSVGMKKRQKMCDDFNNPSSSLVAFLLYHGADPEKMIVTSQYGQLPTRGKSNYDNIFLYAPGDNSTA